MKKFKINLKNLHKKIYSGHIKFGGQNLDEDKISFTNYYMEINNKPFFGIIGEFHFSRYNHESWEDEIIKMKMCGINIIATYIFWIIHEEKCNSFNWEKNNNIRKFIILCQKHNMFVILRIGPFCHGEVKNGGIPDWILGLPIEIRSNDPEYLYYTRRLYNEIKTQIDGLLYKDNGPIIGIQLENEHMHAGAPIEDTVGTSNEWLGSGKDGISHILKLKEIAKEMGLDVPIYTCTGWGGSSAPVGEVLSLWGGYAFRPWIFYDKVKIHPPTEEYIFQDYHNNNVESYNYNPNYNHEDYPYACCEMGGGMQVYYKYRFIVPPESVYSMSIIKIAGGCNLIGYYMFHGGTNPKGNTFMNEYSVPKFSYDYQAPISEFGEIRKSYKMLKRLHYFLKDFENLLCCMKTFLPKNGNHNDIYDTKTLRFAVRTDNSKKGFLFLNNYQDHLDMDIQSNISVELKFDNIQVVIPENKGFNLIKNVSCIMPFNLNINGLILIYSTTQLISFLKSNGKYFYFFFMPQDINGEYCFKTDNIKEIIYESDTIRCGINFNKKTYTNSSTQVNNNILNYQTDNKKIYINVCNNNLSRININNSSVNIITLTDEQSLDLYKINFSGKEYFLLTKETLLVSQNSLKFENFNNKNINFSIFPDFDSKITTHNSEIKKIGRNGIFYSYSINQKNEDIFADISIINDSKAVVKIDDKYFDTFKDIILEIEYEGNIGYAYIAGNIVHDNFCNNTPWHIGLKNYRSILKGNYVYIKISPIKKENYIKSDSPMAARIEVSNKEVARINSIKVIPVYETEIDLSKK